MSGRARSDISDHMPSKARRASDGDPRLLVQGPSAMMSKLRKMQTTADQTLESTIHQSRKHKLKIDPEALADFYKMHESRVSNHRAPAGKTVLKARALDKYWGTNGSWCIFPDVPLEREEPFHIRQPIVLPRGETYEDLASSWGLAAVNMKGDKGDRSPGQDTFALARLPNEWEMFCVFDGHGRDGHWPALRAARTVPWYLSNDKSCTTMLDQENARAAMINAFEKVESEMELQALSEDIDLFFCGCTALCILRHPKTDRLAVGTLGDTRTMIFVPGSGVISQTKDHKPTTPAERARIEAMGCEVEEVTHDDGQHEARVSLRGEGYPGLAMTRSFGDCILKKNGVVAEPECVVWKPSEHPGAMVFGASDGVWEFFSTEDVYKIITEELQNGKTHQEVVEEVVQKSRILWEENEEDYCDDITAVLVPMTGSHSPPSTKGPAPASCCDGIQDMCSLM
mmetsp:Transcript_133741/g.235845  ORF Transcript_133741/g.235845 Transcript_133741/m.235845 type:complete len:455 (-) Transcript_133741:212-1576(-)